MDTPVYGAIPERLDGDEFWELFGRIEHEQLDYKLRPDSLSETIPAMAMTDGGLIVVLRAFRDKT